MSRKDLVADGDDIDSERSSLINGSQTSSQGNIPEIPLCGFLSVQYYQPFFDVDTTDISARIMHSLLYCRRDQNFLATIGDKPDAYGPFWIATTLVFFVAVTSHLNKWFSSWMKGITWIYDFQSVLNSCSIIYGYAVFVPLAVWFVFKQYDPKLRFVTILCLYGYSLFPFIPIALICLVPSTALCWLSLLAGAATSAVFLLRNLAPIVVAPDNKQATVLLGGVGLTQLIFAVIIKLYFYYKV